MDTMDSYMYLLPGNFIIRTEPESEYRASDWTEN